MKKSIHIIAALLVLCIVAVASSCRYSSNILVVTNPAESTGQAYSYNYQNQTNAYQPSSSSTYTPTSALQPDVTAGTQTTIPSTSAFTPTTNAQTPSVTQPSASTPAVTEANPSTWNKQQVVSYLADAVNKTKAYTGNITANRSEDFTINIESISPNLPALKSLANSLIDKFIKPVDEVVQFSNGRGDSEGESIPLLLPKRQNFTLPAEGVAQASASKSGNNIIIDLTLVQENSNMSTPPQYNAQAVGYLDINSVDISVLTIQSLDFVYLGSTIHAVIGPDGYVLSADYTIPLHIAATGKAIGITGSFAGTASQTEKWVINW